MSASNSKADWVLKGLQRLLEFLSSFSLINIDNDMPNLDVSLWRFSPDDYEIELTKRGHSSVDEVFCRVRAWIPVDDGRSHPLDYEQWMPDVQVTKRSAIPLDKIPSELLHSCSPIPGPSKIGDLPWIAVISRRKEVVSRTGVFYGRVSYSDKTLSLYLQLRFFWTLIAAHVMPILLRLLVSVAIILSLVLLLISPSFRGWVARQLQELWEVWHKFSK